MKEDRFLNNRYRRFLNREFGLTSYTLSGDWDHASYINECTRTIGENSTNWAGQLDRCVTRLMRIRSMERIRYNIDCFRMHLL